MAAYLLIRGMKTLELRVERQGQSAQKIAEYLVSHSKVEAVNYPGLSSHPQYAIARRQMRGFGGMLSFSLGEDLDIVRKFLPRLQLAHAAANLGSVETIVGPPATTSHVEVPADERARLGIPEGLIRYSTGIENVDDLLADLDAALEGV
jgi:cystathionine gamma-synthase